MRQYPVPNSGDRSHSGLSPRPDTDGQSPAQTALRVN